MSEPKYGTLLRTARRHSGRVMREVANVLDVNVSYVSDVEVGRRRPFEARRTMLLAQFFDCDPAPLLLAGARERGCIEVSGSDAHLVAAVRLLLASPAEAARDVDGERGDSPPSAPLPSASRVASAGGRKSRVSTRWCSPPSHSLRSKAST